MIKTNILCLPFRAAKEAKKAKQAAKKPAAPAAKVRFSWLLTQTSVSSLRFFQNVYFFSIKLKRIAK